MSNFLESAKVQKFALFTKLTLRVFLNLEVNIIVLNYKYNI